MRDLIDDELLGLVKPKSKPYEVHDVQLIGFRLRVQPSGSMSYICQYGKGKRTTIGKANVFTPAQARHEAKLILLTVAKLKLKHYVETLGA